LDEAAKSSLRKFGIAPPAALIECPRCGSDRTETISEFGSTACKALCRCLACREVFDYFKPF
jgi:ring-1,2-phenylacetyl-CoA epoxidase subunit PaaD